MDDVKRLSRSNYYPDGMTSLYDTIEQSTRLVYNQYLKPSKQRNEIDKLILVVITDGEDTFIEKTNRYKLENDRQWREQELYTILRKEKVSKIKGLLRKLRGHDSFGQQHLETSILIGLTNNQFSAKNLEDLQREISFNDSIAIDQSDSLALRTAFRLFSSNALNN